MAWLKSFAKKKDALTPTLEIIYTVRNVGNDYEVKWLKSYPF